MEKREWGIRPTFCYDTPYERMGQRSHAVSSFVHMSPTKPPQHRLLWHMIRVDNRDSPCDRTWTIILFTRLTAFVGKPNESYKDEQSGHCIWSQRVEKTCWFFAFWIAQTWLSQSNPCSNLRTVLFRITIYYTNHKNWKLRKSLAAALHPTLFLPATKMSEFWLAYSVPRGP